MYKKKTINIQYILSTLYRTVVHIVVVKINFPLQSKKEFYVILEYYTINDTTYDTNVANTGSHREDLQQEFQSISSACNLRVYEYTKICYSSNIFIFLLSESNSPVPSEETLSL